LCGQVSWTAEGGPTSEFLIDGKNTQVRVDSDGSAGDEGFITLVTLNDVHLTVANTANCDLEPSPP
jgi:hypothetical protein